MSISANISIIGCSTLKFKVNTRGAQDAQRPSMNILPYRIDLEETPPLTLRFKGSQLLGGGTKSISGLGISNTKGNRVNYNLSLSDIPVTIRSQITMNQYVCQSSKDRGRNIKERVIDLIHRSRRVLIVVNAPNSVILEINCFSLLQRYFISRLVHLG